ncbi:MAG: hypothetical protein A2W29_09890 [Gemmatimonadetes bacterium RBG_16_66_8]|nr:MAG: hypothetical protein A2W29_09890 [Gemmatimonadetes bacterium RBG_16_66_8]
MAKAVHDAGGGLTTVGMAVGTPQYMAPEQAVADPRTDHRADLYAVAAMGYEMLTGRALFAGRSPQQAVAAQVTEAPVPLDALRPEIPRQIAAAIMRGLIKDPEARWQRAEDFAEQLASDRAVAPPRRSRRRVAFLAVGAVMLAVAAWTVVRQWKGGTPTPALSVVAVMPFTVRGGSQLNYLQERLAWADASRSSADQALRYADRLTAHHRAFLEAVVALRHGETWKSEAMFRDLLAAYPDDAEAWYQLGEIEFHGNPLRGLRMAEAWSSLSRALVYDPGDLGALYHLLRIAARRDDPRELDSLAARFFELSATGDRTQELRALQAFATGDTAAEGAVLAQVARAPENALPLIV